MSRPDHRDWESDPVWKLVDDAQPPKAGPFFVRNVMREVRLSERCKTRWWQRLFAPKPLLAGALGAAAAVVLLVTLDSGDPAGPEPVAPAAPGPEPSEEPAAEPAIDELLKEEMLFAAAEDPSAFTDEALLELLD